MVLLGLALITSFASIMIGACNCRYGAVSLLFTGSALLTSLFFCV
jgi:hypothetical protein